MKASYALSLAAAICGGQLLTALAGASDTAHHQSSSHMSLAKSHLHQQQQQQQQQIMVRKTQESTETCSTGLSPDPLFYLTAENGEKDFTPYFECVDETTPNLATKTCNYGELLDMFRAPCELKGHQLYSISLERTCPGVSLTKETDLPVCLGTTCDVEQVVVSRLLSRFENCADQALSIKATALDRMAVRGEACTNEMESFTNGIGDPEMVYSLEDFTSKFCTVSQDGGFQCDFSSQHQGLQDMCTEQGGILYQYSDNIIDTVTNITDGMTQSFTSPSTGVPICLGSSCDADRFFKELVEPHFFFMVNGTFTAASDGTTTSSKIYRFTGYEQITKVADTGSNEFQEEKPDDTQSGNTETGSDAQGTPETEAGVVSSTSSNAATRACSVRVFASVVVLLQVLN